MEGDTPLNLGSKYFTQLSETFLHYFVDFEVIDGHLNFCSRPPGVWPIRRANTAKNFPEV